MHRKKLHVCGKTFSLFPRVIHVATNKNNPEMPLPSLPATRFLPPIRQEAEGEKTLRISSSGFGGESKNSDSVRRHGRRVWCWTHTPGNWNPKSWSWLNRRPEAVIDSCGGKEGGPVPCFLTCRWMTFDVADWGCSLSFERVNDVVKYCV